MRNFFSFTFHTLDSAKFAKIKLVPFIIISFICIITTGCRVVLQMDSPAPPASAVPEVSFEERIANAEAVKASLLKQLANPKTVDETIRIKDELDKIQDTIETLKALKNPKPVDDDDGFKSVKQKKTYYGPLGLTVETTKWLLGKLLIIHEN